VLATTDSLDSAKIIAGALVRNKLAACCSIVPGIISVYNWNNQVNEDSEFMLFIKTRRNFFPAVQQEILKLHSYDVPEIILLPVDDGFPPYLDWLADSTSLSVEER